MSELEHVTSRDGTDTTPSAIARDASRAVFAHTMGLVALTAGVAALGAYVGRDLSRGLGIVLMIAAIGCILALGAAIQRSEQLAIGLLFAMGGLLGAGVGPVLAAYAATDPAALWQAGGATALFIGGFGAWGYATRRDLSQLARVAFWALLGLIAFGIVMLFVSIPGGNVVYCVLGLVIFAAYTMYDFQRLRKVGQIQAAPLLAASIFLDVFNVFLFFLSLFGGRN